MLALLGSTVASALIVTRDLTQMSSRHADSGVLDTYLPATWSAGATGPPGHEAPESPVQQKMRE